MANGYSGDYAVTLPSFFMKPGDALNQAIGLKEKERDRQFETQQYNQKLQQQNRLGNLGYIDQATAFDKFKVGQQAIDNYSMGKLQEIQQKALTQYANLDPAEMRYRIQQDLAPLAQWDMMAKDQYSNIEKSLQDLNKTLPNANLSKAYDIAMNQFAQDFMQQAPDGSWQNKNHMELQQKDYRQLFENPETLGQIIEDTTPLTKAIQDIKLTKTGGAEVKDNKGNVQSYKWTGELSPFAEPVLDAQNRPTGRKIKSESITLPSGQKIEMLPQEETNLLLQNPAARASALALWAKVKPKGLDANTEDRLFRSFLKDQVEKLDLSYVKPEETEKVAKPPSINIFNNQQGYINDVYKGIDDKVNENLSKGFDATRINALNTDAQNTIMDFVRKTTGNQNINQGNIFLLKNQDGEIGVYKTTTTESGGKQLVPSTDKLIGFLPKVGTNLKAQPDVKSKKAVIQQGNVTTPPPTLKKDPLGIFNK